MILVRPGRPSRSCSWTWPSSALSDGSGRPRTSSGRSGEDCPARSSSPSALMPIEPGRRCRSSPSRGCGRSQLTVPSFEIAASKRAACPARPLPLVVLERGILLLNAEFVEGRAGLGLMAIGSSLHCAAGPAGSEVEIGQGVGVLRRPAALDLLLHHVDQRLRSTAWSGGWGGCRPWPSGDVCSADRLCATEPVDRPGARIGLAGCVGRGRGAWPRGCPRSSRGSGQGAEAEGQGQDSPGSSSAGSSSCESAGGAGAKRTAVVRSRFACRDLRRRWSRSINRSRPGVAILQPGDELRRCAGGVDEVVPVAAGDVEARRAFLTATAWAAEGRVDHVDRVLRQDSAVLVADAAVEVDGVSQS